jgi:hypothetical protein
MLRLLAWSADILLDVLPMRESEFRNFVTEVISCHGEGAVAGVQVVGLPIGKGEGDDDGDDGGTGRGVQVDGGLVLMGLPFPG